MPSRPSPATASLPSVTVDVEPSPVAGAWLGTAFTSKVAVCVTPLLQLMTGLKLPGPMDCGRFTVATNWPGWAPCCIGICDDSPSVLPFSVAAVAFPPAVSVLHETANVVAVPGADGFGLTLTSGLLMTAAGLWCGRAALASAAMVRPAVAATELARRISLPPGVGMPQRPCEYPAAGPANARSFAVALSPL